MNNQHQPPHNSHPVHGPGMSPQHPGQQGQYYSAPQQPPQHGRRAVRIFEKKAPSVGGGLGLLAALALMVIGLGLNFPQVVGFFISRDDFGDSWGAAGTVLGVILILLSIGFFGSLSVISPGDTRVVQFFGRYIGTIRKEGLRMTVPLTSKRSVSVKIRNFETSEIKVNDANGNPIQIASIIVWKVADTAQAVFSVENFEEFVSVQAEAALRQVASQYPYESDDPRQTTLRGSSDQISAEIAHEVSQRVVEAGLEVVETRISSLAYAPEIARAMLQRQQASAVLAAREIIVDASVTMAQHAVARLESDSTVSLEPAERARLISNLLVVLSSESPTSPIVNIGQTGDGAGPRPA